MTTTKAAAASDLNSSLNDFVVTEDAIKPDEKEQDNGRRKSQRIRRNHQLKMETRSCSSDQKMAESEDEHSSHDLDPPPHHGGGGRTTAEAAGDHRAEESAAMLT